MSDLPRSTPAIRQIEERVGMPLPIYLDTAYNVRRLSLRVMAREMGCHHTTVGRYMQLFHITGIRHVGYTPWRAERSA